MQYVRSFFYLFSIEFRSLREVYQKMSEVPNMNIHYSNEMKDTKKGEFDEFYSNLSKKDNPKANLLSDEELEECSR